MADALTYVFVSEKNWHDALFSQLQRETGFNWVRYTSKAEFTVANLRALKPELVFIPHWSYIIPEEVYTSFECIVFHMTDLPYGRGGSPLQNLIVRGQKKTMISAIRVSRGIDTGPVYLKSPLSLQGSATQIFVRSAKVIRKMILRIITDKPIPVEQKGEIVEFKRRKPQDGNLNAVAELETMYDFIRMLDAEGYPQAFLETDKFRFEFSKARFNEHNKIDAHVRIIKK